MTVQFRVLLLLFFLCFSGQLKANKALDYFEEFQGKIGHFESSVQHYIWDLMPDFGAVRAESSRRDLISQIDSIVLTCKEIGGYKRDLSFCDSLITELNLCKKFLVNADQLLKLESYSHKTIEEMSDYLEAKKKLANFLTNVLAELIVIQQNFIEKHRLNFPLNKERDRLERTTNYCEVYQYYYAIYTLFFDGNVKENYIITSIVNERYDQLERQNSLFLTAAKRSLENLESITDFRGDTTLVSGCRQILKFYKYEAEEEFPWIISFMEREKVFKANQKQYLSRKLEELDKAQIEQYEQMKAEYEREKANFDVTIERTNLFRADRLTVWQDALSTYLLRFSL